MNQPEAVKKYINALNILFIMAIPALFFSINKYWAPFDEGIVTVGAEQFLNGHVPYKDFFLVMYPPGQIFVLSALYKIFGVSLTIGRIYTSVVQFIILVLFMRLIEKSSISAKVISFLFMLSCIGPRMGAIPAPIWTGMALSLLGLVFFKYYLENGGVKYFLGMSLAVGLAIIFRHDIGLFLFVSIFAGLFLHERRIGRLIVYSALSSVFAGTVIFYLYAHGAAGDAVESLIKFTFVHTKTAGIPFPPPCFNPVMIFHGSMRFINENQFYIPIIVLSLSILYVVFRIISDKKLDRDNIFVVVLILFGIFTFNQVRARTDPAHLLTVIPSYAALCCYLVSGYNKIPVRIRYLYAAILGVIVFLFLLLGIKNYDKAFKNVISKPFKQKIKGTFFDRGSVYIPINERSDVMGTVSYITAHSNNREKIYIGIINHNVDAFGGSLVLYTLCNRAPSTKYYEILPGLVTQKTVQDEIKESLISNNVRFVILQDISVSGNIERSELDRFILNNYKLVKKFGPYNIYEKNNIP